MVGKNGKERGTTLRDAKKLGLFPSTTAILNVAASPGLEAWKVNQAIAASYGVSREMAFDDYAKAVRMEAGQEALEARDIGSEIHADIERVFLGQDPINHPAIAWHAYNEITEYCGSDGWRVEETFASNMGYGGMVDAYRDGVIVDWKTKDIAVWDAKKLAYPSHSMQLWAYAHGLGMPNARRINVFIDRSGEGLVIHEWENDEVNWEKFKLLLEYWKLDNLS